MFEKLVHNIGISRLNDVKQCSQKEDLIHAILFSLGLEFIQLGYLGSFFNEALQESRETPMEIHLGKQYRRYRPQKATEKTKSVKEG